MQQHQFNKFIFNGNKPFLKSNFARLIIFSLLVLSAPIYSQQDSLEVSNVDLVVYGATPAGITAGISAARAGQQVLIVEPSQWVGGMMSGGLSNTDTGQRGPEIFGGLTQEFFTRVQTIEEIREACIGACENSYLFEPQVAELVFEEMLAEAGVRVERGLRLLEVNKADSTITSILTSRGELSGTVFIDASYEGDLMAMADIPFLFGREPFVQASPNSPEQLAMQEDHAGVQAYQLPLGIAIDPYIIPGDPNSGTIAYIDSTPDPILMEGEGDARVMAFTYRLCVTDDPNNRIPFQRPENFNLADYEVHARLAQAAPADTRLWRSLFSPAPIALSKDRDYFKYDLNSSLTLSTDMTGSNLNQVYVESSFLQRQQIENTYRNFIEGLLFALQTDNRFGELNQQVAQFGYCADEFTDDNGWSHQFYVREGRRMVGNYLMNENDVVQNTRRQPINDSIALGTYAVAAHSHQYLAMPMTWPNGEVKDAVVLEGMVIVPLPDNEPYPISYGSITPLQEDASNMLNPVTLSATNIAYDSIRMEPTFMLLGEAAGTAAAISIESDINVQAVEYQTLRQRLLENGLNL